VRLRWRTLGTAAARAVDGSRPYQYEPAGEALKTEENPLWASPPHQFAEIVAALRRL